MALQQISHKLDIPFGASSFVQGIYQEKGLPDSGLANFVHEQREWEATIPRWIVQQHQLIFGLAIGMVNNFNYFY